MQLKILHYKKMNYILKSKSEELDIMQNKNFLKFYSIFVSVKANLHTPQLISSDDLPDPTTFEWQRNS